MVGQPSKCIGKFRLKSTLLDLARWPRSNNKWMKKYNFFKFFNWLLLWITPRQRTSDTLVLFHWHSPQGGLTLQYFVRLPGSVRRRRRYLKFENLTFLRREKFSSVKTLNFHFLHLEELWHYTFTFYVGRDFTLSLSMLRKVWNFIISGAFKMQMRFWLTYISRGTPSLTPEEYSLKWVNIGGVIKWCINDLLDVNCYHFMINSVIICQSILLSFADQLRSPGRNDNHRQDLDKASLDRHSRDSLDTKSCKAAGYNMS